MPTKINFNQKVAVTLAHDGARVYNAWARKQRLWIMEAMPRDTATRRQALDLTANRKADDTLQLQLHEVAYIFGAFMVPGAVQLFKDFTFTLVDAPFTSSSFCDVQVTA